MEAEIKWFPILRFRSYYNLKWFHSQRMPSRWQNQSCQDFYNDSCYFSRKLQANLLMSISAVTWISNGSFEPPNPIFPFCWLCCLKLFSVFFSKKACMVLCGFFGIEADLFANESRHASFFKMIEAIGGVSFEKWFRRFAYSFKSWEKLSFFVVGWVNEERSGLLEAEKDSCGAKDR